jgi:hypothetical protein
MQNNEVYWFSMTCNLNVLFVYTDVNDNIINIFQLDKKLHLSNLVRNRFKTAITYSQNMKETDSEYKPLLCTKVLAFKHAKPLSLQEIERHFTYLNRLLSYKH